MFVSFVNPLVNYQTRIFTNDTTRVRFLILDFSLISGVDYSAMEAFQSIRRKLMSNSTHMIFCGLGIEQKKLVTSGLFDESEYGIGLIHTFDNLNQALEWCENTLLTKYYQRIERAQSIFKLYSNIQIYRIAELILAVILLVDRLD